MKSKKLLVICNTLLGRRVKLYTLQKQIFEKVEFLCIDNKSDFKPRRWRSLEDLRIEIEMAQPDMIHVAFDYSAPARVAIDSGIPVVLDVCGFTRGDDARDVYESGYPLICPDPAVYQKLCDNYDVRHSLMKNIPNTVPLRWGSRMRLDREPYREGKTLVYIGGMRGRGIERLIDIFSRHGIRVHVYPVNGDVPDQAIHHRPVKNYLEMLREIRQYHVGLAANIDTALDNRVFDYMYAGIPTLGVNLGYAGKFVKRWGICTNEDSERALIEAYEMAKGMKFDYLKWQTETALEHWGDDLIQCYEEAEMIKERR